MHVVLLQIHRLLMPKAPLGSFRPFVHKGSNLEPLGSPELLWEPISAKYFLHRVSSDLNEGSAPPCPRGMTTIEKKTGEDATSTLSTTECRVVYSMVTFSQSRCHGSCDDRSRQKIEFSLMAALLANGFASLDSLTSPWRYSSHS